MNTPSTFSCSMKVVCANIEMLRNRVRPSTEAANTFKYISRSFYGTIIHSRKRDVHDTILTYNFTSKLWYLTWGFWLDLGRIYFYSAASLFFSLTRPIINGPAPTEKLQVASSTIPIPDGALVSIPVFCLRPHTRIASWSAGLVL